MGRVYTGYFLRRVWSFTSLRFAVIMGALVGILSFVSLRQVLKNMPNPLDLDASYSFMTSAIQNTEFAVQLSLGAIIALGVMTVATMLKNRRMQHSTFASYFKQRAPAMHGLFV